MLSVILYRSSKWGKSSFCVVLNLVWKKLRWVQTESRTLIHFGSAVRRWFTFCKPVLCYSLFAHIWLIYYFNHQWFGNSSCQHFKYIQSKSRSKSMCAYSEHSIYMFFYIFYLLLALPEQFVSPWCLPKYQKWMA